ncbi:glycogen/starch synthase, ADP-glucose type [Thermus oshimai JL-2]|uniref:Glycogen synthase n=1 Tax=Thermus oshimai JL-2 TaxID=751945 RepID=K7R7E4_THEOS|nr:glycogen synthase [Thermus oshimai]AFV76894.1 glycogen/starch synthase, ADP-glucose type [Thermus oshimai JL-2]
MERVRVLLVAAEAFPLVKVGGLGDVVGSLPKALKPLGVEATVLLPWHQGLEARRVGAVAFPFEGREEVAALGERVEGGVRFLLLGLPDFAQGRVYGEPDDGRRYVRFALAASRLKGFDLLHAHDWHAALLPLLTPTPVVYTIHNLAHQGLLSPEDFFRWTGLPWSFFHMEALEFYGKVNLMKGGIVFARRVTTVSPSYAEEIQTPAFGEGLDGVLRRHAHKLRGILNGLDTEVWNPAQDPHLPAPYSRENPEGKEKAKAHLQALTGLNPPILAAVSRLDRQKGLDLVLEALPRLLELGFSLYVQGVGDGALEEAFRRAMEAHPGRVHFHGAYDEARARLAYAGADAFLMPSRFEPCGLGQMIAQRYGTPPVVRAVGGLKDTVEDGATGVQFSLPHPEGLLYGVLRLFRLGPEAMGLRGMAKDFSWAGPARAYLQVYREALG